MSWRDQLLPASFRGVPFEVESADGNDGRRKAVLEAPGRDGPFIQDLGRAVKRISLIGFIVGEDYRAHRDRLIDAMSRDGSGELVHPHYGTLDVTPIRVRFSETNREGGSVQLSLEFIVGGVQEAVSAAPDALQGASAAAAAVQAATLTSVARVAPVIRAQVLAGGVGFIGGVPAPSNLDVEQARAAAQEVSRSLLERIRDRIGALDVNLDATTSAGLIRSLEGLADIALADGGDFTVWLRRLQEDTLGFAAGLLSRQDAFRELLALSRELLGLDGTGSGRSVQLAAGTSLLGAAVQAAAGVGTGWESRQAAQAARGDLLEAIGEARLEVDDDVGEALATLRVAVSASVPDPTVDLPELRTYRPAQTEPAIVAAARIYGDPERGEEIASRNRVPHPAFLPAGEPLEVLIHG